MSEARTMGEDKRRHERIRVSQPLKAIDTLSNDELGLVVNVSLEGMMLLGHKAVVDGAVYQANIAVDEKVLSLGVECLWTSEADSDAKSWSGYRIVDISEDNKSVLEALIEALC